MTIPTHAPVVKFEAKKLIEFDIVVCTIQNNLIAVIEFSELFEDLNQPNN